MWALIAGGFMFFTAVIVSLGKASSKREQAAGSHREELLSRSTDSQTHETSSETVQAEPVEETKSHSDSKTPHPSEQL